MKKILKTIFSKSPKAYEGYLRLLSVVSKFIMFLMRGRRVRVTEEEWDYLIVLDACRYDYFRRYNSINGKLEKKISMGSCTPEWLKENFNGYYKDIVYISANPYISNVEFQGGYMTFRGYEHFYRVESVWNYAWDEETGSVHPRKVVEATLRVKEKFPNKRLIIHFIQPHAPYIGETRISRKEVNVADETPKDETIQEIWRLVRNGKIPINKLKKAYEDNLKLVLKEVQRLIEKLEGKIVITSDHGECFGEWFVFSHPWGVYIKELVEVPWLTIEKGVKRRSEITLKTNEKEEIKKRVKKLKELRKI